MIPELEVNAPGQLERDGFQLVPGILSDTACDILAKELSTAFEQQLSSGKGRIGGVRNLLGTHESVRRLASSPELLSLLDCHSEKPFFPVRAIFFDKTPEANWRVPWHQDTAIAVNRRLETAGFEGWSVKEGIPHVIPPGEILAGMVTLRLHLDACDASNGALKVIPGSHSLGKLSTDQENRWIQESTPVICAAAKGDALLMKPLLLHASAAAENPGHRRVLHLEYASDDLPNGLEWFERGTSQRESRLAIIALGSNLGDSRDILLKAMAHLQKLSAMPLLKSSLLETAPVDCPPGSPIFLNGIVGLAPLPGETPESLHAKLQALEKEFGRQPKKVLNEARPLDLDLIAFGQETRATPALTLPHPRAHRRQFVLQPLAEIAPDLILPGQTRSVTELLAALPPA